MFALVRVISAVATVLGRSVRNMDSSKFTIRAESLMAAAKAEAERQDAVLLQEKLDAQMRIPVTMKGTLVGWGDIEGDGSMVVEIEKNPAGEELRKMLLEGSANCLSLGPNPNGPTATIFEKD